jgi:hypothetical protein
MERAALPVHQWPMPNLPYCARSHIGIESADSCRTETDGWLIYRGLVAPFLPLPFPKSYAPAQIDQRASNRRFSARAFFFSASSIHRRELPTGSKIFWVARRSPLRRNGGGASIPKRLSFAAGLGGGIRQLKRSRTLICVGKVPISETRGSALDGGFTWRFGV